MYLEFYGLREEPFSLTPDPEYFFMSGGHKRALSYLSYGIAQRKGFMQLTGEVGSGKTVIVRRLLEDLQDQAVTAYVLNPADDFLGLLRFILKDLGVSLDGDAEALSKTELLDRLYTFLLDREAEGIPVVVIFDEAQNLTFDALEEIRMISNFETTKAKLIQIVFVGQPEFRDMVNSPRLTQLAQRITIRHHLGPLSFQEVAGYLEHRLRVAGGQNIYFTALAQEAVYEYTHGIPRLINVLGDYALLAGFVNETFVLNHRIVNEAIAELEGRSPAEGESAEYTTPRFQRESRRRGRRLRRVRRIVADTVAAPHEAAGHAADAANIADAHRATDHSPDRPGLPSDDRATAAPPPRRIGQHPRYAPANGAAIQRQARIYSNTDEPRLTPAAQLAPAASPAQSVEKRAPVRPRPRAFGWVRWWWSWLLFWRPAS